MITGDMKCEECRRLTTEDPENQGWFILLLCCFRYGPYAHASLRGPYRTEWGKEGPVSILFTSLPHASRLPFTAFGLRLRLHPTDMSLENEPRSQGTRQAMESAIMSLLPSSFILIIAPRSVRTKELREKA